MSYTTWHNYGYGICVDDIKTRDVTRLESMLKLAPNLDREIHRWLEECSISEPVWDDYMEFDQDFMLGLATILQKVLPCSGDMSGCLRTRWWMLTTRKWRTAADGPFCG